MKKNEETFLVLFYCKISLPVENRLKDFYNPSVSYADTSPCTGEALK